MEGFLNSLGNPNVIALIAATAIFVVTVALISFRLINFVITCVLLFFAVASGFAIANNDIVRDYLSQYFKSSEEQVAATPNKQQPAKSEESKMDLVRERIQVIFEQIVEVLSNHSKDHKEDQEKSKQLKTTIEGVLEELEQQKLQLQEILNDHNA